MARKTLENTNFLHKKIGMLEDRDLAWNEVKSSLLNYSKDFHDMRVKDTSISLTDNVIQFSTGEEGNRELHRLPITLKGKSSILNYLELDQVNAVLNSIDSQDEGEKVEIGDIKRGIWKYALKAKEDRRIRLHTVNLNGQRYLQHVSDSRWSLQSEIDLFNMIQELGSLYTFQPRIIQVDESRFTMQLIQGRHNIPDPTRQGGKIYGLLQITISELAAANTINVGFYQDECENGTLFGESQDFSFKALRGEKGTSPIFLKAFFEYAETAGLRRAEVLEKAKGVTFEKSTFKMLEVLAKNANVLTGFRKIRDKVEALAGNDDVAEVANIITRAAHVTQGLTPDDSRRLERVAGDLLETVTA